ncbi:expressed unknown protein [Seminavis robusta]|uniref:Uncharacterized protein n=1 Tax=Seminavis robusta TaxID=568900 RepID=A0A9N8HGY0_9STRA|nr:expressed unknown protein [Seminavis robusta]|eukprot:Sro508_g156880.1 n/a (152) ;mRNA; f:51289-51744
MAYTSDWDSSDAFSSVVDALVESLLKALSLKINARQNVLQVTGSVKETFKIQVHSPEVLILTIQRAGRLKLSLLRSSDFLAHAEGTVGLQRANEEGVAYQRTYRSDKGGYERVFSVSHGDVFCISMEAHHFCSAAIRRGCTWVDCSLEYDG